MKKILAIAGSLRKNSYNLALVKAALEEMPKGVVGEIYDLHGIPLYNEDLEIAFPEVVQKFKEKIKAADAILIATPEYNYSIPGVLKNAIDWASRPYGDNAWEGKPVAVMSASIAITGGMRAQYHLRQVFVYLNMHAINKPELMINAPHEKFDAQNRLQDVKVRQRLRELIEALIQAS